MSLALNRSLRNEAFPAKSEWVSTLRRLDFVEQEVPPVLFRHEPFCFFFCDWSKVGQMHGNGTVLPSKTSSKACGYQICHCASKLFSKALLLQDVVMKSCLVSFAVSPVDSAGCSLSLAACSWKTLLSLAPQEGLRNTLISQNVKHLSNFQEGVW